MTARWKAFEKVLAGNAGPWRTAAALADRHNIHVEALRNFEHPLDAFAVRRTRTIQTQPITDDMRLAAFCHELGHILDPSFDQHSKIQRELVAWALAIDVLATRWTAAMTNAMQACLPTYEPEMRTPADNSAWTGLIYLAEYRASKAGRVFVNEAARRRAEREALEPYSPFIEALSLLSAARTCNG